MKLRTATVFLCATTLIHCAGREKMPEVPEGPAAHAPEASIEAKQLAAQTGSSEVIELTFPVRGAKLSKNSNQRITQFIKKAQGQNPEQIESVKVIAWADEEYPSIHTKELSAGQKELAAARGEALKKRLEDLKVSSIEVINMAERPSVFQTWFQTSDHRIKKALETSGIPNTDTSIKQPSKRGHAIVIVLSKESR